MNAQAQTATISKSDMEERLSFIGLDEASRADIRDLAPLIEQLLPTGLDAFYQKVRQQPQISKLFSGEGHINSAKNAQLGHWATITNGRFDEDYANKVRTIGSVHARIGLLPRWYIGGYTVLMEQLVRGLVAENWPRSGMFSKHNKSEMDAFQSRLVSLLKAILLDMELSVSVYIDEAEAKRAAAEAAAMEVMEKTVSTFREGIGNLNEKNLAHRIDTELDGDYDKIRLQFNAALDQLSMTIRTIGQSAQTIASGSQEVRSAADSLSRSAEQQAAAVEETAAAVEQIAAAVKSSASRAEEAGEQIARTRKSAEQSGAVMRQAVEAMDRINKSSTDISNIISVIDEIAFQTNLLALNAGVEAARAGDAGKGFAVVAQEVRELAQRSASAAKEIKQLIITSGEEVGSGVALVNETGKALEGIVAEVHEITANVDEIITSTREQSRGLQEINEAVASVDKGTQQNAAMAEELTASSHSLTGEVDTINSMLNEFSLDAGNRREPANDIKAPAPRPQPSPARELGRKVANAFGGVSKASEDWEEF
ncbi:globin-coupled sensor protein [Oricola sp.]|uniref:globin-coupled sensor protein n=1 Tax=Oricola sp. TaxID=1979950 RepID=UPI0035191022